METSHILGLWIIVLIAWLVFSIFKTEHKEMPHKPTIEEDILDNFRQIVEISDIHCWEISSNYYFLIAHLVVKDYENYDATISNISEYLQHKHNIAHITLQLQKQKSKWSVEPKPSTLSKQSQIRHFQM